MTLAERVVRWEVSNAAKMCRAPSCTDPFGVPMSPSSSRVTALGALFTVSALLVPLCSAGAQFGKLKKMGGDMIKDAAGVKAEEKTAGKIDGKTGSKSGSEDYTVTAARLDGVLASLAPLMAEAQTRASAKAQRGAYDAKSKAFDACVAKATEKPVMPTSENLQKSADLQKRAEALMQRASATSGKRTRAAVAVQDSARVVTLQMTSVVLGGACGTPPFMPIALVDELLLRENENPNADEAPSPRFEVPASARTGMSVRQYGMVRERIALYALMQAGAAKGSGPIGTFTADEKAALDARAADLTRFMPMFRDGFIRWTTWSEVKTW
jgi:hypothetical protein